MLKNKLALYLIGGASAVVIGLVANSIFKWNNSLNDSLKSIGNKFTNIVNISTSKFDHNYVGNLNVEFAIPSENASGKFSMKGIQAASLDKQLKGRLAIQTLEGQLSGAQVTGFSFKDIDFVVDEEKMFFKIDPKAIQPYVNQSGMTGNTLVKTYMDALSQGKYLYMNGAAANLKMLGKLGENELVKMLVVAMATGNPPYYLEKNGFEQKFRNKYLVKGSYTNYFEDVKTDGNKKYVKIKESICDDLSSIAQSMAANNPAMGGVTMDVAECKNSLAAMNAMMDGKLFVQQDGSKETITYEGMFNLNIAYGDGKLDVFKAQITGVGLIDYSSNKLKIDIVPEMLKMQGHDFALKGDIDFTNKATGNLSLTYKTAAMSGVESAVNGDVNVLFNLENGSIKDWSTVGKVDSQGAVMTIDGKGDKKAGNFSMIVKAMEQEMLNIAFKYEGKNIDLNMNIPSVMFNMMLKIVESNGKADITSNATAVLPIGELKFAMSGNVIADSSEWKSMKSFDISMSAAVQNVFDGMLKSKYENDKFDSSLSVSQGGQKAEFTITGTLTKKLIDLVFNGKGTQGDKEIGNAQGVIKYENTESGSKNVFKGNIDLTVDGQKQFDVKFDGDYSKNGATYDVPSNYVEFDMDAFMQSMMGDSMKGSSFGEGMNTTLPEGSDMMYSGMNSLIENGTGVDYSNMMEEGQDVQTSETAGE